jgi:lipopolysaccharide transport system permease protein
MVSISTGTKVTALARPPALSRRTEPGRVVQVVAHLAVREFRIRYESAFFGWLWALTPALVRFVVLGVVFSALLPSDGPDYLAGLAVGVLGWQWFSTGLEHVTSSPLDRSDLLAQPALPRPVIPVVSLLTDGFDYIAGLPVLLVIVVLDTGGLPATALLFPVLLVLQGCLTLGIGMATAAANVRWRDVRLGVALALSVGIYVTPVFYSAESVPERLRVWTSLNPLGALLEAQRDVLIRGEMPSLTTLVLLGTVSLAVLAGGWVLYQWRSATFLDDM